MKKRLLTYTPLASIIFAAIGSALFAPAANAQSSSITSIFGYGINDLLATVFATMSQAALYVMSYWVALTGALLNVSITLTLHIKDFVDSVPGVYLVWQTVRDVSGLLIIFMLLYAAFKIIIGYETAGGVGDLIKNIVIAGILINFSFFITGLLIDASNVVSLALYNGIVASPTASTQGNINIQSIVGSTLQTGSDGGISGIFMDHLQPQSIYNPANTQLSKTPNPKPFQILIQGVVGCVIMFTIGMSFLLASLAFVARLGILIMLLAFSPIWFAAWVVPGLDDKAKEFREQLKAQLIFMPVYLLLLYAAMRVLTSSSVFTDPSSAVFTDGSSSLLNLVVLAINDFFILFLINLPLVVAFGMGGKATEFLNGAVKRFNSANVWKNVGGFAGSRTVGRAAYSLNQSTAMRWAAGKSPIVGSLADKTLGSMSKATFGVKKGGYEDRLKAQKKAEEGLHKKIGTVERGNYRTEEQFRDAQAAAKTYQANYRANLPWKGKVGGVIGFMVDNRANRETSESLKDTVELEQRKKAKRDIELSRNYRYLKERKTAGDITNAEEVELGELEEKIEDLDAAIGRGNKSKKKQDTAALAKELAKESKDDGDDSGEKPASSGGGDKK